MADREVARAELKAICPDVAAIQVPPAEYKMRDLAITLPTSLEVAVIRLPIPMSDADYRTIMRSLKAMKDALVAKNDTTKIRCAHASV